MQNHLWDVMGVLGSVARGILNMLRVVRYSEELTRRREGIKIPKDNLFVFGNSSAFFFVLDFGSWLPNPES